MGKRGGGGELGVDEILEDRNRTTPHRRASSKGREDRKPTSSRVLPTMQDRLYLRWNFLVFSRENKVGNEMEFLAEDATPAKLSIGARESIQVSQGSSETMQLVNVIVVYIRRGTSLENYPWILSSNKRSRRCDGPLRSLTFPFTFRFLLTVSSSLFQQFKSLASIFQRVKEKRFLINRNSGTR